jgi:hypothetical protein
MPLAITVPPGMFLAGDTPSCVEGSSFPHMLDLGRPAGLTCGETLDAG